MSINWQKLKSWEGLLAVILLVVIILNIQQSPFYLGIGNLVNVFDVSIEKAILALIMTLIIINGEIDLSVAAVMGLSGSLFAWLYQQGVPIPVGFIAAMILGVVCGAFNGFWVAYVGLPSLAVTLAGLIGYRGIARLLLEDRSVGSFPEWFVDMGNKGFIGPFPIALIIFAILFIIFMVVLHFSAFGRYVYVIGNNREAARFSGVKVRRVKLTLFIASSLIASIAGLLYAARLGNVRADLADGFELDIVTMVLLGGVSIFGGTGTMVGVGLSVLLILNIRNGMSLANITGHVQTIAIGILLILSVLIPNAAREIQSILVRRNSIRSQTKSIKQEGAT